MNMHIVPRAPEGEFDELAATELSLALVGLAAAWLNARLAGNRAMSFRVARRLIHDETERLRAVERARRSGL